MSYKINLFLCNLRKFTFGSPTQHKITSLFYFLQKPKPSVYPNRLIAYPENLLQTNPPLKPTTPMTNTYSPYYYSPVPHHQQQASATCTPPVFSTEANHSQAAIYYQRAH